MNSNPVSKTWRFNTSNPGKLQEFEKLFSKYGITLNGSKIDLEEIDADPIQVVVHKASQIGEGILVEDTSLEIDGESVGINVRFMMDRLWEFEGKKAKWTVLLAYRENDHVFVYQGIVSGTIVSPKGKGGWGFDSIFLPDGSTQTLGESKPDAMNARALAVEAFVSHLPLTVQPILTQWEGNFQMH